MWYQPRILAYSTFQWLSSVNITDIDLFINYGKYLFISVTPKPRKARLVLFLYSYQIVPSILKMKERNKYPERLRLLFCSVCKKNKLLGSFVPWSDGAWERVGTTG